MKILQINAVYKSGSTGKIVADLHESLLAHGCESIVCYGRGVNLGDKHVYKFCSEFEARFHRICNFLFASLPLSGVYCGTKKLISIIKNEHPDVVHIHCINGNCLNYFKLITYLSKNDIKIVLTHHAEFLYTGGCSHAYKCCQWKDKQGCKSCLIGKKLSGSFWCDSTYRTWKKLAKVYSHVKSNQLINTAVSPWLGHRVEQSPLLSRFKIRIAQNGVDIDVFHLRKSKLKAQLCLNDNPIIFHATASFTDDPCDPKGGLFVIKLAKALPEYNFLVAAIETRISFNKLPSNLYVIGKAKSQIDLAKLYSLANLSLVVSKRETFSMVTAESLCCGTPVVGFKAGGPESIALKDYSNFVEYGDIDNLILSIKVMLGKYNSKASIAEEAKLHYSKEVMCENYLKVYKELLTNI